MQFIATIQSTVGI